MKKFISLSILVIALFALSGCGSSSSNDSGYTPAPVDPIPVEPITPPLSDQSVDLLDLGYGYAIEGYSSYGEYVILDYCGSGYDLYRDSEHFYGDFNTDGYTINMYDSDGGSYVIDTNDGYLDVGVNYYIYDIDTDITVEAITPISC